MTIATAPAEAGRASPEGGVAGADAVLAGAARLWFVTAVVGQWAFLYYIALFYDAATLRGDFAAWSRNSLLLRGYVPGDIAGNLAFAAHVLLAAVVTFGGALQVVTRVVPRLAALHRWNGRLFVLTAIAGAVSGLGMIWLRGARANFTAGLATSIDAVLIIAFAAMAWRLARARDFAGHRRWALRAWIAANGVWFQRIGIFGWTAFNHAPVGMTRQFDGWFDLSWAFGCYLLPLAVLELYLRVRDGSGRRARYALAAGILLLTVATALGAHAGWTLVWHSLRLAPAAGA